MYKVVLVDDEMFERQGLKSLIDWKSCGFQVVGEAGNGKDALSVIEEFKPDLVITDIQIPVLDGLQLIKRVLEQGAGHPKFIIISASFDFKYTQQAVRYGVHDFFLKPVDKEDMKKTLGLLAEKLSVQNLILKKEEERRKSGLVDLLLFGKEEEKRTAGEELETFMPGSKGFCYMIMEINRFPDHPGEPGTIINEKVKEKAIEIIKNVIGPEEPILMIDLEQGCYGFIVPSNYLLCFQMDFGIFINWVSQQLTGSTGQNINFYIGTSVPQVHLVRSSYEEAQYARQFKYTQEDKNIFFYKDTIKNNPITYMELDESFYHLLMDQVEENSAAAIEETIEMIFHQFSVRNMAKSAVLASVNRCLFSIIKIIKNMDGEVSELKTFQTILQFQHFHLTLTQLKDLLIEFAFESKEKIAELRRQTANGEAYKIKQYVDMNYQENIGLKTIAAKFYMNPVYLGQLFKKTYGIYFKDYLLHVRINEAKKLLRQSEMKVYEIAETVGFKNTDYFVTIFGKLEKRTPSAYRNKLLKLEKVDSGRKRKQDMGRFKMDS